VTSETGDVRLAVCEFRIDVVHHPDHHAGDVLWRLGVVVELAGTDVAIGAAAFIGKPERGYEHVHHRTTYCGPVVLSEDFQVLRRSLGSLAATWGAFATLILGKHDKRSENGNGNHQEDFAHGVIILSPLNKATEHARESVNERSLSLGLSAEISSVLLSEVRPLLGQIVERENRGDRTHWNARPAIDALDWIDVDQLFGAKLGVVFFGVDAIHRTGVHTRRVFCADAGFCYYVSHTGVN
jgi:hypothetical protein